MNAKVSWALVIAITACSSAVLRGAEPASDVRIEVQRHTVDFYAGKELVARYNKGPEVAKPYFWPVNGPGQTPVTRAWPMAEARPGDSKDHVHQKSFWFCHGDVIPEGLELKSRIKGVEGVDFWSAAKGHGRIICWDAREPVLEKNHGRLTTRNEWVTAEGQKVLDETRTIHLYDLAPARLFVFDIDLAANAVPITFGDTKEGAFGVRVNDAIREEIEVPDPADPKGRKKLRVKGKGRMENADGKTGEKECWGQVSAWCDYSGPINGRVVGLAILDDPSNPSPACWHSRAYGLMAANPFGRAKSGFPAMRGKTDLVKLGKGEHLKLRYGLLIHPGDAKEGRVADYYKQFVTLKKD